ncbi:Dipeptidyl peptidase family member 2 [Aphelenchoides bicaudatus]|nr:Dipeptidyl peptidase family member 2 [Aphelenchoides bicaudatus]
MHQLPCESCINESTCVYVAKQEDRFESTLESRNSCQKRTALFVILFIVLLAAIIGCLILLFTQAPVNQNELNKSLKNKTLKVTLDDLLKNPLVFSKSFRIHSWLSDTQFVVQNEAGDLVLFTIKENKIEEGTTPSLFIKRTQLDSSQTFFNSDASKVAFLKTNEHSYPSPEYACEFAQISNIQGTRKSLKLGNKTLDSIQFFQWSPAKNSSEFVFVYNNDIYYQNSPERPESIVRVTHSDSPYTSFGVGDWMIKEEVLEQSIFWSKSGRYIAYASYDSRNTTKHTQYNLSYPRPGDQYLHGVWLFIWDTLEKTRQFALPDDNLVQDSQNAIQYLLSAAWTNNVANLEEVLISIWANRLQNSISITLCPIKEQCFQLFKFKYFINGKQLWAEPSTLTLKFFSATGFFVILPNANSNDNIYNSIAHIDISQLNASTLPHHRLNFHSFAFDVSEIVGYNKERDELFFMGQGGLIGEMHLFRLSNASSNYKTEPQCLTCIIKNCTHATPSFSVNSKNMLIECEAPYITPLIYLKSTSDIMKNYVIQAGQQKKNHSIALRKQLPTMRFETLKLSHGQDAHIQLMLPPNFDPKTKYPLLMSIYAGPNSNSVWKKTPSYLDTYFSIALSAIVLKIDGRGSDLRGWNLKHQVYRHLGKTEIEDQLEALRLVTEHFSFVDIARTALIGWSYGGFATLHASQMDTQRRIKCAVAGGSVVDFLDYDAAYTERYMSLPKENKVGYMETSVLLPEKLEVFRRINLLLVHGLSDENVVFDWNTGQLVRQLQLYNHNFTQLLYPNEKHSFRDAQRHFIIEVEKFLATKCFN